MFNLFSGVKLKDGSIGGRDMSLNVRQSVQDVLGVHGQEPLAAGHHTRLRRLWKQVWHQCRHLEEARTFCGVPRHSLQPFFRVALLQLFEDPCGAVP